MNTSRDDVSCCALYMRTDRGRTQQRGGPRGSTGASWRGAPCGGRSVAAGGKLFRSSVNAAPRPGPKFCRWPPRDLFDCLFLERLCAQPTRVFCPCRLSICMECICTIDSFSSSLDVQRVLVPIILILCLLQRKMSRARRLDRNEDYRNILTKYFTQILLENRSISVVFDCWFESDAASFSKAGQNSMRSSLLGSGGDVRNGVFR